MIGSLSARHIISLSYYGFWEYIKNDGVELAGFPFIVCRVISV